MTFRVAGLLFKRNVFFTNGEPLQEKELVAVETHAVHLFISDLYLGNNLALLRKLWNLERTFTQLYRETILISIYFLNSACLKDLVILVWEWNCCMFCVSVQFLFQGALESSIPGGMEPSSEAWWCALCSQMTWSAWVLVPRARSSWIRSSSTEAMGDDFGSLCDGFQMLFVGTEKHRDMALGYSHQTQAFWDTHRCPLQATEHRPAACWSALGKIARIEGIYFVLYFKGLLWPGRRAGCSWSTPSLCWCREEAEHQVQSPGMGHCTAWEMGKPPTLP